ncbi:MAG: hypothetical protein V7637_3127 [Mycobacteriales bacterium]
MIVCSRCREPNPDDALHCSSCRAYLGWSRAGTSAGGQPQQPPQPPQPPAPPEPGQQWPSQWQGQQYEQQPQEWRGRPGQRPPEPATPTDQGYGPPDPGQPYGSQPYPGSAPPAPPYGSQSPPAGQRPGSPAYGGGQYGGEPPAGQQYGGQPYGGGQPAGQRPGDPAYGGGQYGSDPYGGGPPAGQRPGDPAYGGEQYGSQPYRGEPPAERPGDPAYGGGQYGAEQYGSQAYGGRYGEPAAGQQYGAQAYGGEPPAGQGYGGQRGGGPGPAGPPGIDTGPVPGAPPAQPPRAVVTPPGARRTVNTVQLGRVAPVDPLAPRVPERTIGVSIASDPQVRVAPRSPGGPPPPPEQAGPGVGASGGFEAVQPQDQPDLPLQPLSRATAPGGVPVAAPAAAPMASRSLDAGEMRCSLCGNAVPAGRRFCRCGNSMIQATAATGTVARTRRLPWYRRLGEMFGSGRDFRRAMRSANRGMRATYNVGASARTQMFRVTFLLGSLGLGLSQLGPWGGDLRARVTSQVDRFLPHSYETVLVDQAATDPASKALPGFDVGFAVDGDPGRAWAAPWAAAGTNGQPCHRAGGAPALVVTFKQPSAVARVIVQAGLADGNDARAQQARPRQLDLLFSDGTCVPFDLTDTAAAQHIDVKAAGVTSVRVVIVDAFDARDATGTPLVSLSEVTFQRQK